jgi:uncharacterized protein (TIGR02597 family)
MKITFLSTILLALGLSHQCATAQTAITTDPVGFVSLNVPANSDVYFSVPLNRAQEFKGVISSISGNTLTVAGTPGWTANQFVQNLPSQVKTYCVQIASGTKEGLIARITANTSNTLTVTLPAGEDLTGVLSGTSGDSIDVMPYWTPGSLFPSTTAAGTQLFAFTTAGQGTNLSPSEIYAYSGSTWEDEVTSDDTTHLPLNFGTSFILRNNSTTAFTVSFVGTVPMSKHRIRFPSGLEQDIRIGYNSPIPETISSLNIPAQAGDIIFAFDNAASGINKSPSSIYAYDGTNWVNDITGEPVGSADVLSPGFGYVYRRVASSSSVAWSDLQSYLNP